VVSDNVSALKTSIRLSGYADFAGWMWARQLLELASLKLHLDMTASLNKLSLTARAPPA
jgi:hypothetical protein